MFLKPVNTYHPFTDSYFGIFLKDLVDQDNVIGLVIEDINLHYQPVQKPLVALIFLAIKIFLLVIIEWLQIKVYKLMKKENGIIKSITQLLVCTQMVFWPFWIFFAGLTDFVHPIGDLIGSWFCYSGNFVFRFLGTIILSHSFLSALMRYIFILHREVTQKHGKKKIKNIFFLLSILIPFLVAIWRMIDDISGHDLDPMSFINKCHGKHHRVFLVDTSTLNVAKRNFCAYTDFKTTGFLWKTIRQISCICNNIVNLIIGLNIVESILFYRILSHINRLVFTIESIYLSHFDFRCSTFIV